MMEFIDKILYVFSESVSYVITADDFRFLTFMSIYGAVALYELLLSANYKTRKWRKNYDTIREVRKGALALHFSICCTGVLFVRLWLAVIVSAVATGILPLVEIRWTNDFLKTSLKPTKKQYLIYFIFAFFGIIVGVVLNHFLPVQYSMDWSE